MQIGQGVHELWSDIQTNKERFNFIYKDTLFHTNISYPFIKLKNNNKSSSSFYKNPANSIYTVFFKDSVRGWKIKSMLNMIPIFTLDH